MDNLHQEIQHERWYEGYGFVHDLEEDTELVGGELDEVDGVLHDDIIGIGLQTDEVLHLDVVVLAKQLQHPERSTYDIHGLLLECCLLGIIRFHHVMPLHHIGLRIVVVKVIDQHD